MNQNMLSRMEGYNKNTEFNPHIFIKEEDDDDAIVITILKTDEGIACLRYGKERKIFIKFDVNANASLIAKYVSECLKTDIVHTVSTNLGTLPEKIDSTTMHTRLTTTIEYMNIITLARHP